MARFYVLLSPDLAPRADILYALSPALMTFVFFSFIFWLLPNPRVGTFLFSLANGMSFCVGRVRISWIGRYIFCYFPAHDMGVGAWEKTSTG